MPVYEFVCKQCGHPFEELVLGSELPACPECNAADLEKQLSVFAVSGESDPPLPDACRTCGDPRGPGACPMG